MTGVFISLQNNSAYICSEIFQPSLKNRILCAFQFENENASLRKKGISA